MKKNILHHHIQLLTDVDSSYSILLSNQNPKQPFSLSLPLPLPPRLSSSSSSQSVTPACKLRAKTLHSVPINRPVWLRATVQLQLTSCFLCSVFVR